jgi:hypothetical protein
VIDTDTVENTIRGCASFGNQDMDMGMEVDAITESLDHGHHSRHKLKACHCVQESHKSTHRRETERIEELSLEAEEKTQHLGNSKDDLSMGNVKEKFLPHPLPPLLTAFSMAGGIESACLAGKHQEPLFSTVRAPDAGKAAHRIATVEITLNQLLNCRPEIPVLPFKTGLIF